MTKKTKMTAEQRHMKLLDDIEGAKDDSEYPYPFPALVVTLLKLVENFEEEVAREARRQTEDLLVSD